MVRPFAPHAFPLLVAALTLVTILAAPTHAQDPTHTIRLAEVVTDPQTDWDKSGSVTTSDEYVALRNTGTTTIDLAGWRLVMTDSTPEETLLEGNLAGGATKVLLNPKGVLNNDVGLALHAPDGRLVDEAMLADNFPSGDASGVHDEAVHLLGAWRGQQAPATLGAGLGPLWVESVAPVGAATPALFGTPWFPAGPVNASARLHIADGVTDRPVLLVAGTEHTLIQGTAGTWTSEAFTAKAPNMDVAFRIGATTVATYPHGSPLRFPVDPTAPVLPSGSEAMQNGTGYLRWVPTPTDPESGLRSTTLYVQTSDGTDRPLLTCEDPLHGIPTCPLPANITHIRMHAQNEAGATSQHLLPLRRDITPPALPTTLTFEPAVPPRFGWPAVETLLALRVDLADDPSGTWNRTTVHLTPDARTYTDSTWLPGTPRAYRLVGTDLAGNTNATPWVALPPDAVPVQAQALGLDVALAGLVHHRSVNTEIVFDRDIAIAPQLVLETRTPVPYRLVANASMAPDARSATYALVADGAFPATGAGVWRLAGGSGTDGAPANHVLASARWDGEAPHIDVTGNSDGWIAAKRHVVLLGARDRADPHPNLEVAAGNATQRARGHLTELAFEREGEHAFTVTARDHNGNTRREEHVVRLDGTPPRIDLAAQPTTWSSTAPVRLMAQDVTSGIVPASLRVTVRSSAGEHAANVTWNGTEALLWPAEGSVKGPFQVQVSIADAAGNRADGLLGTRLTPDARIPMSVVINGTTPIAFSNESGQITPLDAGGSQFLPSSGGATHTWADYTLPAHTSAHDGEDEGSTVPLVASLVGAGVIGLGTVIHRRRGARRVKTGSPKGGGSHQS